ncbi:MAG TPA: hypothetical protein VMA30_02885 [Xanthobacteraceae bacterium]|nr:hypothetical protein [Xanthobacteraceae bacterium]
MKLQPRARAGIALAAAYAVALQALLLAVTAPAAGLAGAAALPICTNTHSSPAGNGQTGHGQDCLDACLTGCCCGTPLLPTPPHLLDAASKPLQTLAAPRGAAVPVLIRFAKAHRSRAPPVA